MCKTATQDQVSLNAGQKYCRMLPLAYSAIQTTFIKLRFVIKIFVLSIFEWPIYTGFYFTMKKIKENVLLAIYGIGHTTSIGVDIF